MSRRFPAFVLVDPWGSSERLQHDNSWARCCGHSRLLSRSCGSYQSGRAPRRPATQVGGQHRASRFSLACQMKGVKDFTQWSLSKAGKLQEDKLSNQHFYQEIVKRQPTSSIFSPSLNQVDFPASFLRIIFCPWMNLIKSRTLVKSYYKRF